MFFDSGTKIGLHSWGAWTVGKTLSACEEKAAKIRRQLREVWRDAALSDCTIRKWVHELAGGRDSIKDADRLGRPRTSLAGENVRLVEMIVM